MTEQKKPRGRPRAGDDARTKTISVRLSPSEYAKLLTQFEGDKSIISVPDHAKDKLPEWIRYRLLL